MTHPVCNHHESQDSCQTAEPTQEAVVFEPRVDIVESEHELTLYADLPGVQPENLDIQFDEGELKIHGKCAPRQTSGTVLLSEYKVGDFTRSFTLGETLDAHRISAELKNGVLTVHLPKVEKPKPRRVEIKS